MSYKFLIIKLLFFTAKCFCSFSYGGKSKADKEAEQIEQTFETSFSTVQNNHL